MEDFPPFFAGQRFFGEPCPEKPCVPSGKKKSAGAFQYHPLTSRRPGACGKPGEESFILRRELTCALPHTKLSPPCPLEGSESFRFKGCGSPRDDIRPLTQEPDAFLRNVEGKRESCIEW